jgi:hypothetical protein
VEEPKSVTRWSVARAYRFFAGDDVWPGTPAHPGDHGAAWSDHVFQLGCHQDLCLDDLGAMADTLREIFSSADQ